MSHVLSRPVIVALLAIELLSGLGISAAAIAQGEGPRAYQLVPDGTQSISQILFALRGNSTPSTGLIVQGADIDLNLGVTQYGRAIDIAGHQAGLLVLVPYGNASGSLSTEFGTRSAHDSGLGDIMLGVLYGIYGTPSLSRQDYMEYDPGFAMALLTRATLPTGSYDSDSNLNMGSNRAAFELGVPLMYYLGSSYLDTELTSFELLPKVTFFSENTDAIGETENLKQDALFTIEGHITRNFGRALWGSLDAFYEYGGETTSDNIDDNNKQRSFSIGATVGLNLSQTSSVKISYGDVVSGNPSGSDGRMLRAQVMILF